MKFLAPLALTLCSASAFVQKSVAPATSTMEACISKDEIMKTPNTIEFGQVWDPLGLAEIGSDETLAWYRHSEIKHGRVAMAAVRYHRISSCLVLSTSSYHTSRYSKRSIYLTPALPPDRIYL